jgi:hypothetical protein
MNDLQVSKRDKGSDVEVVNIHGAGRDVRGHVLEGLKGEELGSGPGSEDFGVLVKERDDNGVIVFLHVILLSQSKTNMKGRVLVECSYKTIKARV